MSSLSQLRQDHADIVCLIDELRHLTAQPVPPPSLALFDARRRLSNHIISHLKSEDWLLYPPLLASPDPGIAATAQQFVKEMGGLAKAFSDFVTGWDALKIEANWAEYCRETSGILDALMNRLVRENRELLPLLEKVGSAA